MQKIIKRYGSTIQKHHKMGFNANFQSMYFTLHHTASINTPE